MGSCERFEIFLWGFPALFHHQTGYILLEGEGRIFSEQRTNSWNDIMKIYPKSELQTKDVFTIYMNHGILPKMTHINT